MYWSCRPDLAVHLGGGERAAHVPRSPLAPIGVPQMYVVRQHILWMHRRKFCVCFLEAEAGAPKRGRERSARALHVHPLPDPSNRYLYCNKMIIVSYHLRRSSEIRPQNSAARHFYRRNSGRPPAGAGYTPPREPSLWQCNVLAFIYDA